MVVIPRTMHRSPQLVRRRGAEALQQMINAIRDSENSLHVDKEADLSEVLPLHQVVHPVQDRTDRDYQQAARYLFAETRRRLEKLQEGNNVRVRVGRSYIPRNSHQQKPKSPIFTSTGKKIPEPAQPPEEAERDRSPERLPLAEESLEPAAPSGPTQQPWVMTRMTPRSSPWHTGVTRTTRCFEP